MYLVVVETDDGQWLNEPDATNDLDTAKKIAAQMTKDFGTQAKVYACVRIFITEDD
jgi:hypothetical protein